MGNKTLCPEKNEEHKGVENEDQHSKTMNPKELGVEIFGLMSSILTFGVLSTNSRTNKLNLSLPILGLNRKYTELIDRNRNQNLGVYLGVRSLNSGSNIFYYQGYLTTKLNVNNLHAAFRVNGESFHLEAEGKGSYIQIVRVQEEEVNTFIWEYKGLSINSNARLMELITTVNQFNYIYDLMHCNCQHFALDFVNFALRRKVYGPLTQVLFVLKSVNKMQDNARNSKKLQKKQKAISKLAREYQQFKGTTSQPLFTTREAKQASLGVLKHSIGGRKHKHRHNDSVSTTKEAILQKEREQHVLCMGIFSYKEPMWDPLSEGWHKLKKIAKKKKIFIQIPMTIINVVNHDKITFMRNDPYFGYISVMKYPKSHLNKLLKKYFGEDSELEKGLPSYVLKEIGIGTTTMQILFKKYHLKEKLSMTRGETYIQKFIPPKGKSCTKYRAIFEKGQLDLYMISNFQTYEPPTKGIGYFDMQKNRSSVLDLRYLAQHGHISQQAAQSTKNLLFAVNPIHESYRKGGGGLQTINPSLSQKQLISRGLNSPTMTRIDIKHSPYLKWGEEKQGNRRINKCRKGANTDVEMMASELIKLYSYQYFFTENLQIDFMALDFIQDKNGKFFYIGVKAYKTIERELSKPTKPPEELIAHTECNGIFCRTENIDFAGRMMNGLKRAGWQFGKKTPRFTLHREIIDFNLRIELYDECEYVYYGEPNYFPFVDYLVRQADSHKMVKYNSNLSFFCPLPVCEICYQLYLLHNQKIVKMTGKYMPNQITMLSILMSKRFKEWTESDIDNLIKLCSKDCIFYLEKELLPHPEDQLPILNNKYSYKEKANILKEQHSKNNYFGYSTPTSKEPIDPKSFTRRQINSLYDTLDYSHLRAKILEKNEKEYYRGHKRSRGSPPRTADPGYLRPITSQCSQNKNLGKMSIFKRMGKRERGRQDIGGKQEVQSDTPLFDIPTFESCHQGEISRVDSHPRIMDLEDMMMVYLQDNRPNKMNKVQKLYYSSVLDKDNKTSRDTKEAEEKGSEGEYPGGDKRKSSLPQTKGEMNEGKKGKTREEVKSRTSKKGRKESAGGETNKRSQKDENENPNQGDPHTLKD